MIITWIGKHEAVAGDIEFLTEKGERITLTAKEIRELYMQSRFGVDQPDTDVA